MQPLTLAAGTIGFLVVALGAFGAHGLKDRLTAAGHDWWATATLYALVHAIAALSVALAARQGHAPASAGWAFLAGCVIFSGSLYAMALGAPRWFGAITPVGGLSFLAGWGLIVFYALRR